MGERMGIVQKKMFMGFYQKRKEQINVDGRYYRAKRKMYVMEQI